MKNLFFIIFAALPVLSLYPSFVEISDQSELEIKTPDLQKRKTAKILLDNGLAVYLISDPDTDQSAASLAVKVGSWEDPKEYPGLAHFIEHLLFMGTQAYPEENGFKRYINDHGGMHNAFTAPDRTVYMFSINNDYFLQGLKRFSRFFIDPLLSSSSMGRELSNIDEEYAKNIESDGWREYMISKKTGNTSHPHHMFTIGNTETLSGVPPILLRNWFKNHYSANIMRLVVYSSEDIETLKQKIDKYFSLIPNKYKDPFYTDEPLSSDAQKGHITYIEPVKEIQVLKLTWELPRSFAKDSNKPAQLAAYAINRGHKHSLEEILKKEGLIEGVNTSVQKIGNQYAEFSIDVYLTKQGMDYIDLVVQRCYETLHGLRDSGIPKYLFQEMQTMAKLNYEYQNRKNAFSYVEKLCTAILDESIETFPQKTVLCENYSLKRLSEVFSCLSPKECKYTLLAKKDYLPIPLDETEKWFGTNYAVQKIPDEKLSLWRSLPSIPEIQISPPNPFLPTELSILSHNEETGPKKIIDEKEGCVFFLKDNEYQTPEVVHMMHIYSPVLDSTPRSQVFSDLYLWFLERTLEPTLACAEAANLKAKMNTGKYALNVLIKGYSEKASFLIEEILKELQKVSPSEKEFEQGKEFYTKYYQNRQKDLAIYQAFNQMESLLSEEKNTYQEKFLALEAITYEEFLDFKSALFEKTYLEAFLSGNITLKDAESIWIDVRHILASKPFLKELHYPKNILSLNEGPFVMEKKSTTAGNAALLVIDQGVFTFKNRGSQQILASALKEAFFDTLRTKQKTGYIVHSMEEEKERRLFQYFTVQSSSYSSDELLWRFEAFLEEFCEEIQQKINEDRFNDIRQNLIHLLTVKKRSLEEKTIQLDTLAFSYYEDFSWLEKRSEALQDLTYEEFIGFSKEYLHRSNRKRLAVLIKGRADPFYYEKISPEFISSLGNYSEEIH